MLISDLEGTQRKEKHEGSLQNQSERGQRELNSWGEGCRNHATQTGQGLPFLLLLLRVLKGDCPKDFDFDVSQIKTFKM